MKPIKTKIIATVGPAAHTFSTLKSMVSAGVDLFRINFSHCEHSEAEKIVKTIRKVSGYFDRPIGILADLQGPKIRVGIFENGHITIKRGSIVAITGSDVKGKEGLIPTIYKNFVKDIKKNDTILVNDGLIKLKALKKDSTKVYCKVINGGIIKNHKGINLPGVKISSPSLTAKDKKDLICAAKIGVDYLGLSFVRSAGDIKMIKSFMKRRGIDIPVIAKIEKGEALKDIEKILNLSDGIMVARGDLGTEIPAEQVPPVQKRLISLANKMYKPVITATQMMESMIENPIPTRAEVSDVSNAIFDGTDAVMLSGETSVGKYPVRAVSMMNKIAANSESSGYEPRIVTGFDSEKTGLAFSIVHAACEAAAESKANWIVVYTETGKTALNLSKRKPTASIIALASSPVVAQRLCLYNGVIPVLIKGNKDYSKLISEGRRKLLTKCLVKKGQVLVMISGDAHHDATANTLKMVKV
ncbi:MAG: pyruvate kinase [Candidatus Aureabacteria bacterium]|nr:pyruvate kinase [Candidatus Auribacterota bacterium]